MVPAQCYERTLRLNVPTGHGSAFTIDRHGRQWLVTARHVVDGLRLEDIEVVRREGPVAVALDAVPMTNAGADIAVFAVSTDITPQDLTLHATTDGAVYSQDAYFLGYPYGLGLRLGEVTHPFVKKAILSASEKDVSGVMLWFLDGINNPGFSGGPVVFCQPGTNDWHVAAVVSAYRTEQVAVRGGAGVVSANTGIIVAYEIAHATDSIDAFVGAT